MPAGISQSVANPAALTQRPQQPQPQRDTQPQAGGAGAASEADPADERDQVVRAPGPAAGTQGVENTLETGAANGPEAGAEGATSAQPPEPEPQGRQVEVDRGVGGNVDVTA